MERDKVIELEDYTRRENLKFHNIPESEVELESEKKTNTDRSSLASFAERTETKFLPGRRELKRVQGSRTLT